MNTPIMCWRCGAVLRDLILPLSRREECAACGADQHVCKLCQHYQVQRANQCAEDRAEEVSDKERANFCDYFIPSATAYSGDNNTVASAARDALAQLFGEAPAQSAEAAPVSAADAARAELEKLFKHEK